MSEKLRLDRWLWAARFYKTRTLAAEAIRGGKIQLDDQSAKVSQKLRVGSTIRISKGTCRWTVRVLELSEKRGPASEAQKLYEETPESQAERERISLMSKVLPGSQQERTSAPGKRQRRELLAHKRRQGS